MEITEVVDTNELINVLTISALVPGQQMTMFAKQKQKSVGSTRDTILGFYLKRSWPD